MFNEIFPLITPDLSEIRIPKPDPFDLPAKKEAEEGLPGPGTN